MNLKKEFQNLPLKNIFKNFMKEFIPQMRPLFGKEEQQALNDYMKEDGYLTEFKRTEQFEKMISEFTGSNHCVVVNNGTISLTLSAIALGIEPGDEVIVPNFTMVASPNSVKMIGAKPIFVDVEERSLCLNLDLVKKAITNSTKAIILVSANGRYPDYDIDDLLKICKEKKIKLIEDAAQSLGSYYPDGTHIGRKGHVGSFSFSAPKIISTGQGGAIITDDDEIAFKLRRLKDFGRSEGGNDIHDFIGYNFKFTELQAVIGIEQMKKLSKRIERKKSIFQKYFDNLSQNKNLKLIDNNLDTTSPWFIEIITEERNKLMEYLKEKKIGTRIMYPPINNQKAYKVRGNFPVSELIGEKGLWLPSMSHLEDNQINYICNEIKDFYQNG